MAKDDFDFCVEHTITAYEGGYSNDAGDPGGATNWGITIADYREFKGHSVTANDVRHMPKSEAVQIYERKYGPAVHFAELPAGPDYTIYDYGVNSGPARPIRVVQTLLKLPVTGRMGADTIAAIGRADPIWLINSVNAERLHFMHAIRGGSAWARFGGGWGRRVKDVIAVSTHLARGATPATAPKPDPKPAGVDVMPKAVHAPDAEARKKIATTAAGGAVGAGASSLLGSAHSLEYALAIGAAVIVAGVIVWVAYHRKLAAANAAVVLPPGVTPKAV